MADGDTQLRMRPSGGVGDGVNRCSGDSFDDLKDAGHDGLAVKPSSPNPVGAVTPGLGQAANLGPSAGCRLSWRARGRVAALGVAVCTVVGALVVGCAEANVVSGPVSSSVVAITGAAGTATRSNPAPYMSLWDPCSLPKAVQEQFSFDPNPRAVDNLEPQRSCSYERVAFSASEPGYSVNVIVTSYSFDESKVNPSIVNGVDTTVGGGRPAVMADMKEPHGRQVLWGTSYGSVLVQAFPIPWGEAWDTPSNVQNLLDGFVAAAYPHIPK